MFYKRPRRISRFKWRDRSKSTPIYATSAAPLAAAGSQMFAAQMVEDCLKRSWLTNVQNHVGKWCIATIASPGYEQQVDDLFTTISRYGEAGHAQKVLLVVDGTRSTYRLAAKHGALAIPVESTRHVDASIKAALYSIADSVKADFYLCLDSDLLAVSSLQPLMRLTEKHRGHILAARSAATVEGDKPHDFYFVAQNYYNATQRDADLLCQRRKVPNFLRLNSGVFAADAVTMKMLDIVMTNKRPQFLPWLESGRSRAADELCFSLAVAELGGALEISKRWNLQLYAHDVYPVERFEHARGNHVHYNFHHNAETVALLHFAAAEGRAKLPKFRELLNLN
jgi:hypothetical protein